MRPLSRIQSKVASRRCSLKPPLRTKSVGTKVSETEFALLEERARGAGLRLAEWVRVLEVEPRLQVYYCNTLIRELDPAIQRSTIVERWIAAENSQP